LTVVIQWRDGGVSKQEGATVDQTVGERIAARLMESDPERWADVFTPDGSAAQRQWPAEDGWLIVYTTEKVDRGRWEGKYVTMAYRPYGKGSRSGRGKATQWRRVYARPFSTRKAAKARALDLYAEHSPKYLAKNGRWWRKETA
jgi:hypothetical protein